MFAIMLPPSGGNLSHLCEVGASLPLTRETISICLPRLICLGLLLHQKGAGNLKAPSLHLSLSFALILFFSTSSSVYSVQTEIGSCKHSVPGSSEKQAKKPTAVVSPILMLESI